MMMTLRFISVVVDVLLAINLKSSGLLCDLLLYCSTSLLTWAYKEKVQYSFQNRREINLDPLETELYYHQNQRINGWIVPYHQQLIKVPHTYYPTIKGWVANKTWSSCCWCQLKNHSNWDWTTESRKCMREDW